ncbi:Fpg/Nei family DNA glycosylase [Nakamurella flavida]|uniref:Fpg/Nei family DNA glycosylase n=1 Tax=Nakamurella flavida TaxID=363630 RepID=A0A939C1K3_9ACTN|nr:Fpg/Nei family DNA glycosylase [Nakamurella flavida]MBM9477778.1 Fpg/Nei family DNA glycosylase [Nakamurella flavida]MDP9779331.1 formamidopyrimidine-DNA glycosylase [Nakamurella flavida]
MPELPEVTALASFLTEHAGGHRIGSVMVTALNVLTTYDPPVSALVGRTVAHATRHGKYVDLVTVPSVPAAVDTAGAAEPELHVLIHLARAGWLRWSDQLGAVPPKMGGPIALRLRLENGAGFDITEAGTRKSVSVAVVRTPTDVPRVAALGPDALSLDRDGLAAVLRGRPGRLKTVLTDQAVLSGVGNAYSDEILHVARLSPFATAKSLTEEEVAGLSAAMHAVLTDAIDRTQGMEAARLKGEKRTGLRVHARTGLPCPVCGDTVAEVSFTDRSFQYCPTCQTGGRLLADRRRSRLDK